jgi:eukaryotic-like serine/threonine-protein kinase
MTVCGRCSAVLVGEVCARCLLEEPLEVWRLGDVEVGEELGRGGMAAVYRGVDTALNRPVALKLLPDAFADQPELVERFRREAQLLARVNHPGVVRVFGAGEQDGVHWLTMELVEGSPVVGPMAPDAAVELTVQVCEALAAAHAVGVVHRDVKPSNVLVDAEGRVTLVDFGVASSPAVAAGLTGPNQALGTPGFMAPEALTGAPPSPALDVYAAGALLYTLLVGHPPEGAFVPAPVHDDVIRRALAPDPAARFPTVQALADALRQTPATAELHPGLPADEIVWLRATAAAWTLASGAVLYAILLCLTPEVLDGDAPPLVVQGARRMADGRLLSMARFETVPILAGLATLLLVAAPAHGALLGRWRRLAYPSPGPDASLPQARWQFVVGVILCGAYVGRIGLEGQGIVAFTPYIPVVAGLAEVVALWWFWAAILEAIRRGRRLSAEPILVFGFLLGLVPPVHNLARYLSSVG